MKKLILASTLTALMGTANASDSLNWDLAEISYQQTKIEGESFKGVAVAGSKTINENFFALAKFAMVSKQIELVDYDVTDYGIGLGYRYEVANQTDLFATAEFVRYNFSANLGNVVDESEGDNGYELGLGVRSMVAENFELMGSLGYIKVDDLKETTYNISARYHVSDRIALGAGYSHNDEMKTYNLSAALFF